MHRLRDAPGDRTVGRDADDQRALASQNPISPLWPRLMLSFCPRAAASCSPRWPFQDAICATVTPGRASRCGTGCRRVRTVCGRCAAALLSRALLAVGRRGGHRRCGLRRQHQALAGAAACRPGSMLFRLRISVLTSMLLRGRSSRATHRAAPRARSGGAARPARAPRSTRAAARSTLRAARDWPRARAGRCRRPAGRRRVSFSIANGSACWLGRSAGDASPASRRLHGVAHDAHALVRRQLREVLAEQVGGIGRHQQVVRAPAAAWPSGGRPGSARTVPRW
jgi:hypothetical protein